MSTASDWRTTELHRLVEIDPEVLRENTDGDYRFYYVDVASVSEGKIDVPSVPIAFRRSPSRARKVIRRGDVLMSTVRPNLKAFAYFDQYSDNCVASTGFAVLRAKPGVDPRFVLYTILSESVTRQIDAFIVGSNYPAITSTSVNQLKVLTPSLPEQSKIAEVLSTVDRAIAQTEALIAKQQRIKTGLMQDLLTRGIDEHGQLRSEATHRFKDSPLGRIPVEWEVRSLGQALAEAKGYLQTGPFGSQLHAHEYTHTGVPVIMPQDILQGFVSTAIIARIPELRANDLRRHRVVENDIVFSRRGDLTRAAAIGSRETGWLCGTGCFLLRAPSKNMSAKWLAHLYRHHWIRRQIETNSVGSTMPSLNNGVMEQLVVSLPTADEQHKIAKQADAMYAGIELLERQLDKQRAIKTALMQDLLTGKVRVTPLLQQTEAAIA